MTSQRNVLLLLMHEIVGHSANDAAHKACEWVNNRIAATNVVSVQIIDHNTYSIAIVFYRG